MGVQAVVTADVELVRLREEEERLKALIDRIGAEEDRKGEAAGKAEGVGNGADGTPGANGAGAARKGRGGEGTEKEEEEEEGDSEEEEEGEEGEDVEMEDVGGKKLKKGQGQEKRVSRKQAKKLGKGGGKDKAGGKGGATEAAPAVVEEDEEEASAKLTAVYERMREIGAEAAEARASKILAGLGFSKEMQVRSSCLCWRAGCSTGQCRVQYRTVGLSAVQYFAVRAGCRTGQYGMVQDGRVQYSAVLYTTMQYIAAQ